jgi:hypothetical protein
LILIDALSSALGVERKEKEKRSSWGLFSQGWRLDKPCLLCWTGFLLLLGVIKG